MQSVQTDFINSRKTPITITRHALQRNVIWSINAIKFHFSFPIIKLLFSFRFFHFLPIPIFSFYLIAGFSLTSLICKPMHVNKPVQDIHFIMLRYTLLNIRTLPETLTFWLPQLLSFLWSELRIHLWWNSPKVTSDERAEDSSL